MRRFSSFHRSPWAVGATAAAALIAGSGIALADSPGIADGHYANVVKVRSPTILLRVGKHGTSVLDLQLDCAVAHPTGSLNGELAYRAPEIKLAHGRFAYDGKVRVTHLEEPATVATATMKLTGHHVDGPIVHYTYNGQKHEERTAFTGTISVSGSLCGRLTDDGHFQLFGPGD